MAPKPPALLAAAAFAACVLIWGSTWLAIKVGYEGLGALTGASLRFYLASGLLAALALARGKPLRLRGAHLRLAAFVGVAMFVFDYGLIYWAEQSLPSAMTAVLFATMPFSTGLLAWAALGEPVTLRRLGGAAVGLLGLAVLFREGLRVEPASLVPMLAVLAAAVFASAAGVATKKHGRDLDSISLFAVAQAIGATGLLAWALLAGERPALPSTPVAWASVGYLAVFGSVVAFLLYFWLLRTTEALKMSLVIVLTPLVALVLGAAVLREALGLPELLGGALVLAGVALAVTAPAAVAPRSAEATASSPAAGSPGP